MAKTMLFHIKILRLRLGWSHSQMASHLKCSVEQLKAWESARTVSRALYQEYLYNLETAVDANAERTRVLPLVEQMVSERKLEQVYLRHSAVKLISDKLNNAENATPGPGSAQVLSLVADKSKSKWGNMSKNSRVHQNESAKGDPVIAAVIDELVALTGWDPVAIWPNQNFHSDLEMSEGDFLELTRRLSQRLLAEVALEFKDWHSLTLRDLVHRLRDAMDYKVAA